jgi:hypothetical protein
MCTGAVWPRSTSEMERSRVERRTQDDLRFDIMLLLLLPRQRDRAVRHHGDYRCTLRTGMSALLHYINSV